MKIIEHIGGETFIRGAEIPSELVTGHVFVKVLAVSIGPFDLGFLYPGLSKYFTKSRCPNGVGSDFSGTVVAVGDSVNRFKVGDEVFGVLADPVRERSGSEYISVHESVCAMKPGNISHEEAASLAFDLMMAERTLRIVKTSNADSILITGGISNIARLLTQLASSSMFDSVEWVAASVDCIGDKEYSESFGVAETFTTSSCEGKWSEPFQSGINRKVYNVVIDTIGESKQAKRLLDRESTPSGRFVSLYNKVTPEELMDYDRRVFRTEHILKPTYKNILSGSKLLGALLTKTSGRSSYSRGQYYSVLPSGDGEILERLSVLIQTEIVTAVIEKSYSLEHVAEAVEYVKKNWKTFKGKVVIRFQDN